MKKYLFASVRGEDFESFGVSPMDAWFNLVEQEKDTGRIWRTMDQYRNAHAVEHEGFTALKSVAYKEISQ